MTTSHVVLRDVKDADGSRLLQASLTSGGDIVIEGRDFGAGVERIFGYRETSGYGPFQRPVWVPCYMHCKPPATSSPHSESASAGRTLPSSARSSNHTVSQPTDGLASVTRCEGNARCSWPAGLTRCFKGGPYLSSVDDAINSVIGYQTSPLWAAGLVLRRGARVEPNPAST